MAKVEQLERGLLSRTVIGQAQGILIERHKVTAGAAFGMLVMVSSRTNRKVYEIAGALVLTGELTGPVRPRTRRGVHRADGPAPATDGPLTRTL